MRNIITTVISILISFQLFAQAPSKMSYQAVIRNSTGDVLVSSSASIITSILQGDANGTVVYSEIQVANTNQNGLMSIQIGAGGVISGNFSLIDWANGPYFLKTETDLEGTGLYSIVGVTELLSVPYAKYAETSGSSIPGPQGPDGPMGPMGPQGPNGIPGPVGYLTPGSAAGVTPYWNGSYWVVSNTNVYNNGTSVGIGTTSPDASAKLDVSSTTQMFLPPRMTTAQRDAIASPASGGIIFNSTTRKLQSYLAGIQAEIEGTGSTGTWAQWDGPIQGQTITPISSGKVIDISSSVAIRTSDGDIQVKIYDGVGGNLLATSDHTVTAPWIGSEFNFVLGTWTFNNANLTLQSGTTYFVEFSATNNNQFFIGTSDVYPRGEIYTGTSGNLNLHSNYDIDFILNYGGTAASWEDLY